MNKKISVVLGVLLLTGCASGIQTDTAKRSQVCEPISESTVISLFERWNNSLQTGSSQSVVDNYAERSLLLPTLSGKNRITREEKEDYFTHFLEGEPSGTVTARQIDLGCNMVTDSGLYTFSMAKTGDKAYARYTYTYRWDGNEWLITNHHSSLVPDM